MITGYLVGDRELIARIQGASAKMKAEIDRTVTRLGFELQARVQTGYLTGQVLHVRTGRLRSSISPGGESRSRTEITATSAIAYVGTNVSYGAFWEHGFTSKIGAGARGGPRTLSGQALATYFARHPPGTRQEAARPFLAPALRSMRGRIESELGAALRRGMLAALKP